MLYAAICDDNMTEARFTERRVVELLGSERVETECFSRSEELLSVIERCDYRPDIAVLDIQMDSGMDGITLAKRLNAVVPGCAVIFLTGFEGYCSDVYSTEHVFFIDKARVDKYLPAALEKAVSSIETATAKPARLCFSVGGTAYNVPVNEVLYFERRLRKTIIVTGDRQYTVTASPSSLLEQVDSRKFTQCHQSFWVNISHIRGINAKEIQLKNGECVPVSRSKVQTAKSAYFALIGKAAEESVRIVTEA